MNKSGKEAAGKETGVARLKSRKRRAGLIMAVVACVLVASYLMFKPAARSFPALSDGSYVGQITDMDGGPQELRTLFIERVPQTASLLMVVFAKNFRPQAVLLNRQYAQADEDQLTKDLQYDPVSFEFGGRAFSLSGRSGRAGLSGGVYEGEKKVGEWNLAKVSLADAELADWTPDSSFNSWLSVKAEHRLLSDELQRTKDLLTDRKNKLEKLQKFIKEEDLLRARAAERKEALQQEVKQVTEERNRAIDDVTNLADSVEAFMRISKEGRAVETARRINERESKWYLANWRSEEDQGGMEEFIGDKVDLDLEKLDAAVLRAQEIRRFEREILDERRKIAELERRIRGGRPTQGVVEPEGPSEGAPAETRSLWDRLFN